MRTAVFEKERRKEERLKKEQESKSPGEAQMEWSLVLFLVNQRLRGQPGFTTGRTRKLGLT
jgi:hypothetical protein